MGILAQYEMKTIKNGNEIQRVKDSRADELITAGWVFCSKKLWKAKNPSTKAAVIQKKPETPTESNDIKEGKEPKKFKTHDSNYKRKSLDKKQAKQTQEEIKI